MVQVGDHRDQVGPYPVQGNAEHAEERQADQAQRLLVDLLDAQRRSFHHFAAFGAFLGLVLAFGLSPVVRQAAGCHRQAANEGGLDHDPHHQQVEGVDQAVGEFQCGVVVTHADGHDQYQRQQGEGQTQQQAQGRGMLAGRAAEQQARQYQSHQGITEQDHAQAEAVLGQAVGLVLGHGDHGDQRDDQQTEAADLGVDEVGGVLRPVEVAFGHAMGLEDAETGVQHQPG